MGLLQRFTKLQKKKKKINTKWLKYTKNETNIKYNKIKEIKLIPKANLHGLKTHGSWNPLEF